MSNKLKPFKVDVSPEMQLYKILQRQSYGVDTALAEFVDNSIQSFIDKKQAIKAIHQEEIKLVIKITVNTADKRIVIEDNAGGINRENFQRAIKMGHDDSHKHKKKSLSVYGIGMKSAAVWFSDTWRIETSALGSKEKLITSFDLSELLSTNEKEILVNTELEDSSKHYTKIIIDSSLRDLKEDYFQNNVLTFIQETFFKFKDSVDIKLTFDGIVLETATAFLESPQPLVHPPVDTTGKPLASSKDVSWKKRIDLNYAGRSVRGFIMIMGKGKYKSPGVRLLRNRRVILGSTTYPNKPDTLVKTSNKFSAQRIYGEIHLNDFPVNFTKTGFDENLDGLYSAIKNELRGSKKEDNYIQQAEYYRARKSTSPKSTKPKSSTTTRHIEHSLQVTALLEQLKSKKHMHLYKSICKISLAEHPILAYVGAWVLLESLASHLGKESKQAFDGFYNQKINAFTKDIGKRNEYKTPIKDIHQKGNLNKHSGIYEAVDAKQLVIDFKSIELFLIFCIEEVLNSET